MARKPLNFDPPGETSGTDNEDNWKPEELGSLPLLAFIPTLSPEYRRPEHLREWCELIERVLKEPLTICNDVPIQHGKTETTLHGLVWLLCRKPDLRIVYMTYDHERAQKMGQRMMTLATRAGVGPTRGTATKVSWMNAVGGGMETMSAAQSREGCPIDLLVVDDPMQEHDARDKSVRDAVESSIEYYRARMGVSSRLPGKGSTLVIMSRWDIDDQIGRMLARSEDKPVWIHHPAIVDIDTSSESAWAPEVVSLEELQKIRRRWREVDPSERLFFARLMGNPRPDLSESFRDPTWYYDIPTNWGFREAIGLDLSYSVHKGSDFCSITKVHFSGDIAYVRDVIRCRKDSTSGIESALRKLMSGAQLPIYMYASGPEIGLLRYLYEQGLNVVILPARYNKMVRAQKTIARWNEGKILIPNGAPWTTGFVQRLKTFTGLDGGVDDEADALVSVCDGNWGGSVQPGGFRAFGTRSVAYR